MWKRLLVVACIGLVAACGSVRGPGTASLTFAQMQSINQGVSVDWLLGEYPFARNIQRRPDGSISQLEYIVTDPRDKTQNVVYFVGPDGFITSKRYSGPIVRPPSDDNRPPPPPRNPSGAPYGRAP